MEEFLKVLLDIMKVLLLYVHLPFLLLMKFNTLNTKIRKILVVISSNTNIEAEIYGEILMLKFEYKRVVMSYTEIKEENI